MSLSPDHETLRLAGLPILRTTRRDFAALLVRDCAQQQATGRTAPPRLAFAANGQVVAEVGCNPDLMALMRQADYIVADGMPVVFASRLFYTPPLPERIATTDFFHDAAQAAIEANLSFYFLGNTPALNEQVCAKIQTLYPQLRIAGSHHGFFTLDEEPSVIAAIQQAKPDVLWIGLGFPKQESFVLRHKDTLSGIGWVATCGGLFDHILAVRPRAPLWIQKCGFEWLHRLACEPRRLFWRYFKTNPLAAWFLLTRSGSRAT